MSDGVALAGRTVAPTAPVDTRLFPTQEKIARRKKADRVARLNRRLTARCLFCPWTASGDAPAVIRAGRAHVHEHGIEPTPRSGRAGGRPNVVDRTLAALRRAEGRYLGISEVAAEVNAHRDVAARALRALAQDGKADVRRDGRTKVYRFRGAPSSSAPDEEAPFLGSGASSTSSTTKETT